MMAEQEQVVPDYVGMSEPELLEACGDDAAAWAAEVDRVIDDYRFEVGSAQIENSLKALQR